MITFLTALVVFASLRCGISYAQSSAESDVIPPEVVYYDQDENAVPLANVDPALDSELARLSSVLMQVLEHSWGPSGVPMVYVEERAAAAAPPQLALPEGAADTPWKRSRYYRRYPWKRQNSRSRTYEPDNRYMCQPTREDVFKLLVALHETRAGNGGRSINFCNRRRSAGAIFTNIRFLGRK